MTTITTRSGKGSALSFAEVDGNFTNLNTDKLEGVTSSVDGELTLWSSTTGKVLKRATITGLVKATSGVASAATAGTDYAAPGTAQTWTVAQTFRAASAVRSEAASTQDAIVVAGRAGGTSSYAVTLTPATLASNTTLTLPNVTDTVATIGTAQTFTAAQRGSISALTDGATITPDFSAANNYSVTLGGNRTLANPTNLTAGQSGSIFITQDGTGSRTLAYGSYWDFIGGTAPTLTTAANSVDRIDYVVRSSTSIHAVFTANYS